MMNILVLILGSQAYNQHQTLCFFLFLYQSLANQILNRIYNLIHIKGLYMRHKYIIHYHNFYRAFLKTLFLFQIVLERNIGVRLIHLSIVLPLQPHSHSFCHDMHNGHSSCLRVTANSNN